LVSISTDKAAICFLEKYSTTNIVAIIPIASPMPKYCSRPISTVFKATPHIYYKLSNNCHLRQKDEVLFYAYTE
jgi:hypothetical protein